jgi:hypothetical protein
MFQRGLSHKIHHTDLLEIKLSKNSIENVRIRREIDEKFFLCWIPHGGTEDKFVL